MGGLGVWLGALVGAALLFGAAGCKGGLGKPRVAFVSNNAVVDLKAKTATCMLSIPYEWTLPPDASASEALFLGFAAASVEHDADHHRDVTRRSTIQVAGPLPLPPSGTTTTLAFATSL